MDSLISIIVPCFNVEEYIVKIIESIKNQTYKNWECIIINDGSSDNTSKLIKELIQNNDKFIFIEHENKGLSKTRNIGINVSNGDYLLFYDSDDLIPDDCLLKLTRNLGTDIIFGETSFVIGQSIYTNVIHKNIWETNKVIENTNHYLLKTHLEKANNSLAHNRLYKKSFIQLHNLRFFENIYHEDELWFFETLFHAKSIFSLEETTYNYNISNQNSITKKLSPKNIKDYLIILKHIYFHYYIDEKNEYTKNLISIYLTQFKNIIFKFSEKIPNIDIELKKEILTNFRLVKTVRTLKILSKQNEKLLSRLELLFSNNYETISFGLKVLKSKNRSLFFTYLWLRNFLNTKNFI